jgi:FAD synthetase
MKNIKTICTNHINLLCLILAQRSELSIKLQEAIRIIDEAIDRYGDGLAFSFNGGKDCTVILALYSICLLRRNRINAGLRLKKIPALYIVNSNSFTEIDEFVEECRINYNIELVKVSGPMKVGLLQFLNSHSYVKAILIGTRKTDPYGHLLSDFCVTSEGWPECMRVHPILNWSYNAIWDFLLLFKVPYCSLYDKGYTSLGDKNNTHPNPLLINGNSPSGYSPAYLLKDDSSERCGRI